MTLPEAAYLAVLPKAPSNYDPVRATQKAIARRNYEKRDTQLALGDSVSAPKTEAAATTAITAFKKSFA